MTGNPTPRPTLKDVSARTGLSIYSVSRALSGQNGVSDETRERVRAAAAEVGYVANQLARSLKGNSSKTIGIVAGGTANQYYATLIGAFDQALRAAGYQSMLADTMVAGADHGRDRETQMIGALLEQRVAAIVVTYTLAPSNVDLIAAWKIPMIFVDCVAPAAFDRYPAVACDNASASRLVAEHFADHGYRKWAYVGYPKRWSSGVPRQRAFLESAEIYGASVAVIEARNDAASAFEAMTTFLADHPAGTVDAIYCANTPLLQGTLQAVRNDGRRVGQDIGIIAFDEFDWSGLLQPSITLIDQHTPEIGRRAAQMLLQELARSADGDASTAASAASAAMTTQQVDPTLVIRQSCGCSPAANQKADR